MAKYVTCFIVKGKLKFKLKQQLALSLSSSARTKTPNSVTATPTIIAAVDSGASNSYFPASFKGEAPRVGGRIHDVHTANGNVMHSVATDRFMLPGVPANG